MTSHDPKPQAEDCTYCKKPGVDCCVRLTAPSSSPPSPVFAHRRCAEDHGIKPLYDLTPKPTRVVAFPWA